MPHFTVNHRHSNIMSLVLCIQYCASPGKRFLCNPGEKSAVYPLIDTVRMLRTSILNGVATEQCCCMAWGDEDMDTVYIFGAGATKAVVGSAPLMKDLLPQALRQMSGPNRPGHERAER